MNLFVFVLLTVGFSNEQICDIPLLSIRSEIRSSNKNLFKWLPFINKSNWKKKEKTNTSFVMNSSRKIHFPKLANQWNLLSFSGNHVLFSIPDIHSNLPANFDLWLWYIFKPWKLWLFGLWIPNLRRLSFIYNRSQLYNDFDVGWKLAYLFRFEFYFFSIQETT